MKKVSDKVCIFLKDDVTHNFVIGFIYKIQMILQNVDFLFFIFRVVFGMLATFAQKHFPMV
jgi:hypothetical protein